MAVQLGQHSTGHSASSPEVLSRKLSGGKSVRVKTRVASLAPTYKQLKTLAFGLWCELPGHWNDFTIPDNDGPARRQTRLGSGFLRPLHGEFQKEQALPMMNLMILPQVLSFLPCGCPCPRPPTPDPPIPSLQSFVLDPRPPHLCFPIILESVAPYMATFKAPPHHSPAVTRIGHIHLAQQVHHNQCTASPLHLVATPLPSHLLILPGEEGSKGTEKLPVHSHLPYDVPLQARVDEGRTTEGNRTKSSQRWCGFWGPSIL